MRRYFQVDGVNYAEHYHHERNHQGLENHTIPFPDERLDNEGDVTKSTKLGGLLSFYYRESS